MRRLLLIIFILSMALVINGCDKEKPVSVEASGRNSYNIKVDYDAANRTLKGTEKLVYINKNKTVELYFHLYPNVYKEESTAPEFNSIPESYPAGFNDGYIDINTVKINGEKADFQVEGQLLKLELAPALQQSEAFAVEISFQSKLPEAKTRYGKYQGLTHCSYWYPILAVYDEKGWNTASFYSIGESSYSETADYLVSITLPKGETVAATGNLVREKNKGFNKKTVTYEESNIRDFAWFSASDFKVAKKEMNGITYCYYYQGLENRDEQAVLGQCTAIFDFYGKQFGIYPYKQFGIVKTQVATSEFPELVTITDANLKDGNILRMALAHEIAHQWWYLAVGNNQREEPWLDEALASYSTHLYNESLFGDIATQIDVIGRTPTQLYRLPIDSSVEQFKIMGDYGDVVYNLGCIALNDLRDKIGKANFDRVLSRYYKENLFKNAKTEDFIKTIEEISGQENAVWFGNLLTTSEHPSMTKNQTEAVQSKVMDEEQKNLKSGEMYTFFRATYGEKTLYQSIHADSLEDMHPYEGLMPILKLDALGGEPLSFIDLGPDYKALERWAKEGYGKKFYTIQRVADLGGCAYFYGESSGNPTIWAAIFPMKSSTELVEIYNNIVSKGTAITDGLNIVIYSFDTGGAAAFELNYKDNRFGVVIINTDKNIEIEPVVRQVYENLKDQ